MHIRFKCILVWGTLYPCRFPPKPKDRCCLSYVWASLVAQQLISSTCAVTTHTILPNVQRMTQACRSAVVRAQPALSKQSYRAMPNARGSSFNPQMDLTKFKILDIKGTAVNLHSRELMQNMHVGETFGPTSYWLSFACSVRALRR